MNIKRGARVLAGTIGRKISCRAAGAAVSCAKLDPAASAPTFKPLPTATRSCALAINRSKALLRYYKAPTVL